MADKKCSYCGTYYTNETGHNYDQCVEKCKEAVSWYTRGLSNAKWALEKAQEVQRQTWWRKKPSA